MTIAMLEALTFGLGRLVAAAERRGTRLCLLTGDRGIYRHELSRLDPDELDVLDVDTDDAAACMAALEGVPGLRGLINSTDRWSVPGADLAAKLGLPGPDPDTARTLRDKARVRTVLRERGLSAARTVPVPAGPDAAAAVRRLGLPAVLKDSAGTSSRNVWPVRDEDELTRALTAAAAATLTGTLVAEPFIAGPIYSAETLSWGGCARTLAVTSRQMSALPEVREEASALPVDLAAPDAATVRAWVSQVLAAVGHEAGFAHVEFALTRHGPELIEVNPRIGGALVGEALCRALGANVYQAMVDIALGHAPQTPLPSGAGPATGFALVYARRRGRLLTVAGVEGLGSYPGAPQWYPTMVPGAAVEHLHDQRACTGIVLVEGTTAELALHRVVAAAGSLEPVVVD